MSADPPVHRPAIARAPRKTSAFGATAALAMLGGGTFLWLANARAPAADAATALPPLATTAISATVPLEPPPPSQAAPDLKPAPMPAHRLARPISPAPFATMIDPRERLRAPALVVDLAQATAPAIPAPQPDPGAAPPAAATPLSDTEHFSARVGGEGVDRVEAEPTAGLDRLIPQGAIIAAVMETALNSDLPGYARALVQRDVLSFDGSAVLIPAGSRVIGQYKSGVAQGASRIFIIWTRVMRPDGVSIALASPAIDELGRGGVAGQVNRHFFQRFGGAILLSVLTGGINAAAAAASHGSTVLVGSIGQASSLAGEAAGATQIPPTIVTQQGTPVRIFVARDLDFTRAGPAK